MLYDNRKNSLGHYGILGMKWGRRKRSSENPDYSTAKSLKKKKVSEMSNKELEEVSRRLNLEKQYRQLNPTKVDKGKKAVGTTLSNIGKLVAFSSAVLTLVANGEKIVDMYNKAKKAGALPKIPKIPKIPKFG